MSYQRISGFGETTTKPPLSALVMPVFAVGAIGMFLFVFRKEIFGPQKNLRELRKAA